MDEELMSIRSSALDTLLSNVNYVTALLESEQPELDLGGVHTDEITHDFLSLTLKKESDGTISDYDMVLTFRKLEVQGMINHSLFASIICDSIGSLRLELLLLFMKEYILPLSLLLTNTETTDFLFNSTLSCCQNPSRHSTVKGITVLMVKEAFPMDESVSQSINASKGFLKHHIKARFDSEKFCSEDYSMMHAINECADLPIEMIKRTNRYIFSNIVCSSSAGNIDCRFDGFEFQSLSPNSVALFSLLENYLETLEIIEILQQAVIKQNHLLDWKWMLISITCSLHLKPTFREKFSDLLFEMVEEANSQSCKDLLLSCIILARQLDSYKGWFKKACGQGKNKRNLHLLIETLTSVVPLEPAKYMKIQLEVLSGLSDRATFEYCTLMRTRLVDLNCVSFETDQYFATKLIKQSMEEFCHSGRIPPKIIQICIFNSSFYLDCFLPLLLSVSAKEEGLHALITELFKQGRIPKKMYSDHVLARSVQEEHIKCVDEVDKFRVVPQIVEAFSRGDMEAVDSLRSAVPSAPVEQRCVYDLNAPGLLQCQVEFVDELIHSICKEVTSDYSGNNHKWVSLLLDVVSSMETIVWPLLVRLWELVSQQITTLSPTHMRGIACIMVHFAHASILLSHTISLSHPYKILRTYGQCGSFLLESLPLDTQNYMKATFQFAIFYLLFFNGLDHSKCSTSKPDPVLLAKFAYIHSRLSFAKTHVPCSKLEDNAILAQYFNINELSYSHWLQWELKMHPHDDFLLHYERVTYLEMTLQQFLARPEREGGLASSLSEAFKQLFIALLGSVLPSYSYGISLLRYIISSGSSALTAALLPEVIHYALETMGSCTHFHETVIKVVCDIPTFFFTGVFGKSSCVYELKAYADCLLDIMSRSPKFLLPSIVTLHITKVLCYASKTEEFCSCSPLYHASLLSLLSESSSAISSAHTLGISDQLIDTARQLFSVSLENPPPALPPEVLAMSMYHKFSNTNNEQMLLKWFKEATHTVAIAFFDCCTRELTEYIMLKPTEKHAINLLRIAEVCVDTKPWVITAAHLNLQHCEYQQFLVNFRKIFSHGNLQLIPYVFFRILSNISTTRRNELYLSSYSLVPLCISNHLQLMDMQEVSHVYSYQAFEMNFLGTCTEITEQCIKCADFKLVKNAAHHWTINHLFNTS